MRKLIVWFVFLCSCSSLFASPYPIEELVFFGDSLSDNGNLYHMIKFIPKSPPYYRGEFSNGPVWAEWLGHVYYTKYNVAYQNYAIGGATAREHRSDQKNPFSYSLKYEVDTYLNQNKEKDKSNSLMIVWIGGNDFLDDKRLTSEMLVKEVMDAIVSQMRRLISEGVKQFVVFDLPDFSMIPYADGLDSKQKKRLSEMSLLFHDALPVMLAELKMQYPNSHFIFMDAYHTFNDILANIAVYNEKYGMHISDTTHACWEGGYALSEWDSVSLNEASQVANYQLQGKTPCSHPENYLFWDAVHPSAVVHNMLGQIILEQLEAINFF